LLATLALLLVRAWAGPVRGLVSNRSTLNIAAFAFLSFCALLLLANKTAQVVRTAVSPAIALALCALATIGAFAAALRVPFLFDDYVHLMFCFTESWQTLLQRVVINHPTGGDLFFRPLADMTLRLLFQVAGFDFTPWHIAGLSVHVANTLLVLLLCRRVCAGWFGGVVGGLFFGWHAAHVEAVSWLSAIYDLLATLFVLLALLEVTSGRKGFARSLSVFGCGLLACVSKESAYCLPLLAAVLAAFEPARSARQIAWHKTLWVAAACTLVFTYRFWYLGGLGGYQAVAGGALAMHFRLVSALQALALRLWALLFVPVNWSVAPGIGLRLGFCCLAAAVAGFAWCARLRSRRVAMVAAFTLCAALPVISLLLIGADLSGARILYLPSIGAALLWAEIAESVEGWKIAVGLSALLLAFQFAALQHNEAVWSAVARTARQACLDAGAILKQDPGASIFGLDLPRTKDGVYFLQNAFPACVAINSDVDSGRIGVGKELPVPKTAGERVMVWDDASGRLIER
jgi:hypothetical protein